MNRESKVQLGVRVPESIKTALEVHALERHLDLADITREALREYIDRHPTKQPLLPHLAEKEKVAV